MKPMQNGPVLRPPTPLVLIAVTWPLLGCPQLLNDDFHVIEEVDVASASGGRRESASSGSSTHENVGRKPEVMDCSDEVVWRSDWVIGFEDWPDEGTTAQDWRYRLNYGDDQGAPITGTFGLYGDSTGRYSFEVIPGGDGSSYAVSGSNPKASSWGGGVMLCIHCVDASGYEGLEFWAKGVAPNKDNQFEVSLIEDGTDEAKALLSLDADWTRKRVPFSSLMTGDTLASGSHLRVIKFSSILQWAVIGQGDHGQDVWGASPGTIEVSVDSIRFY